MKMNVHSVDIESVDKAFERQRNFAAFMQVAPSLHKVDVNKA